MTDTPPDPPDESYDIPPPNCGGAPGSTSRKRGFHPGDCVRGHDNKNRGTVVEVNSDDDILVSFVNRKQGGAEQVHLPASALSLLRRPPAMKELKLTTLSELLAMMPPTPLVEGTIYRGSLIVIYGPPGCGKTFLAISFAMCVAIGRDWFGRKAAKGRVIYIAGEGLSGLGKRIRAWSVEEIADPNVDPWTNIQAIGAAVPLLDAESLEALLDKLEELPEMPSLIVIDTLARCFVGGDENNTEDMGLFVQACDRIRTELDAAVMVVHHTAKPSNAKTVVMERGSSALRAAADTMIEVSKIDGQPEQVKVSCEKQKEAEPFAELTFDLVTVSTLIAGSELPVSSCRLVLRLSEIKYVERHPDLDEVELKICRALRDGFDEDGAANGKLQKSSEVREPTFGRRLLALVAKGYIERKGEHRAKRYLLTAKFTEPSPSSLPITITRTHEGKGAAFTSSPPLKGGESESESDGGKNSAGGDGRSLEGLSGPVRPGEPQRAISPAAPRDASGAGSPAASLPIEFPNRPRADLCDCGGGEWWQREGSKAWQCSRCNTMPTGPGIVTWSASTESDAPSEPGAP